MPDSGRSAQLSEAGSLRTSSRKTSAPVSASSARAGRVIDRIGGELFGGDLDAEAARLDPGGRHGEAHPPGELAVGELLAGDVHGDPHVVVGRPAGGLAAGGEEGERAEGLEPFGQLGLAEEAARGEQAEAGVVPAQQRLARHDRVVLEADLGLVVEDEEAGEAGFAVVLVVVDPHDRLGGVLAGTGHREDPGGSVLRAAEEADRQLHLDRIAVAVDAVDLALPAAVVEQRPGQVAAEVRALVEPEHLVEVAPDDGPLGPAEEVLHGAVPGADDPRVVGRDDCVGHRRDRPRFGSSAPPGCRVQHVGPRASQARAVSRIPRYPVVTCGPSMRPSGRLLRSAVGVAADDEAPSG